MPLVSRRLRDACRDPSTWPELRVLHSELSTQARWRSFLRWLTARASGLRLLVFGGYRVRASISALRIIFNRSGFQLPGRFPG